MRPVPPQLPLVAAAGGHEQRGEVQPGDERQLAGQMFGVVEAAPAPAAAVAGTKVTTGAAPIQRGGR